MKLIIAYVRPEKLADVKNSLLQMRITKMSVTNALGCGEERGYLEKYRGADIEVTLLKKVRLEVAVNEEFLDPAIDAIVEAAKTGQVGDGKIFVIDLAQCVRIRTGDRGGSAIG